MDIVETEVEERDDAERLLLGAPLLSGSSLCRSCFRPLSSSSFASCSSATPFLKIQVYQYKNLEENAVLSFAQEQRYHNRELARHSLII